MGLFVVEAAHWVCQAGVGGIIEELDRRVLLLDPHLELLVLKFVIDVHLSQPW